MSTTRFLGTRSPAQLLAAGVGAVFLLVGVLGFVPGVTTDYDSLAFAGRDSHAMLLGLFEVSVLHNIVHLAFGVAGLLLARTSASARLFLIGGGAIYLALWMYGLAVGQGSSANFVPLNPADNWLHFGLGLGMVAAGLSSRPSRPGRSGRPGRPVTGESPVTF